MVSFNFLAICVIIQSSYGFKPFSISRKILRINAAETLIPVEVSPSNDGLLQDLGINWTSGLSTNTDLDMAIDEIIDLTQKKMADTSKFSMALFFVSSVYETTTYKHSLINDKLKSRMPGLKTIIGCTTGAVIGPLDPGSSFEPSEIEGRAAIGITFVELNDVDSKVIRLDSNEIRSYISGESDNVMNSASSDSVNLVFATESAKSSLGNFATKLKQREGVDSFGVVASGVTSLHFPKIFSTVNNAEEGLVKFTDGLLLLSLSGNIRATTVVARSCLPVGGVFRVLEADGNEILQMARVVDGVTSSEALPPLVQLDAVLSDIPEAQSDALKRELLMGVLPEESLKSSLSATVEKSSSSETNTDERIADGFFGQKPTTFDPIKGSISIPSLPGKGCLIQYCIRDAPAARQDAQKALRELRTHLEQTGTDGSELKTVLMLGSIERGNKVFRYKFAGVERNGPVFGMFAAGSFSTYASSTAFAPVLEADSLYAVITSASTKKGTTSSTLASSTTTTSSSNPIDVTSTPSLSTSEDIMTAEEMIQFNDEQDGVIIEKRDADSSHAVRVAGMDYFVPDKLPQPKNVLESIVWDREKEMDRLREKMPMARALVMAKMAEKRHAFKNLRDSIAAARDTSSELPPVILVGMRGSPYCSMQAVSTTDPTIGYPVVRDVATMATEVKAAAVGYHVDAASFGGSYEDLAALKEMTPLPVICDDFILYGYQLFRAKASGADVVKILASVVPAKDVAYLVKTAKALSLSCIVVVASKTQLMSVLEEVPTLEYLSVTSRNMRLWKVAPGKGSFILSDPEVKTVITAYNNRPGVETRAGPLVILQEGFVSREELQQAKSNGVDAVILGEELLRNGDSSQKTDDVKLWTGLRDAVKRWIS
eukprot:gene5863-11839_t